MRKSHRIQISIIIIAISAIAIIVSIALYYMSSTALEDNHMEFLVSLKKLDAYCDKENVDPNRRTTPFYQEKQMNGIWVFDGYLQLIIRVYTIKEDPTCTVTVDKLISLYDNPNDTLQKELDRIVYFYQHGGQEDVRTYVTENVNAYKKYEEINGELFNGKKREEFIIEDYVAMEEWAVAHPDEELYPKLISWYANKDEKGS